MKILKMTDLNLENLRVLIREDLNVPIENGHIASDARIIAAIPTIEYALQRNARVLVMSHLGRPVEGQYSEEYSLAPLAERMSQLLGQPVRLITDWSNGIEVAAGEVVLLENVRFNKGEKANDKSLAKKLAGLCDIFVMDAFATAHRAEASTCGIIEFAQIACAGPLLVAELEALHKTLDKPARPLIAIVGGAKVSTKLTVLESLLTKVDQLIVGGGIANTFIAAAGYAVGKSLYEAELLSQAKHLLALTKQRGAEIPLPLDVVVAKEFAPSAKATVKNIDQVANDEMILDIGPKTADHFANMLKNAGTIVWNGPVGVFEWDQFGQGTKTIAQAIAVSKAFSIAGGGDTLAAIEKYRIGDKLSYISTGGGAFLEFLEDKKLPAVAALEEFAQRY